MDLNQLYGFAAIPVITALFELLKRAWPELPPRFYPVASLVIGVAWNVIIGYRIGADMWFAGLLGVIVGLSASGLYSQGKTIISG